MLNKISKKYAFSGLFVLLAAGAVLFFVLRTFDGKHELIPAFRDSSQSETVIESVGPEGISQPDESIPHAVIESSMAELSDTDQQKLQAFIDVSRAGRDNDPRIDKDLRGMSAELKSQIKNYYRNLAPEKRNERGLVSFLIARDLNSSEDIDFLHEVMTEDPCLSMQDCKVLTPRDPHLSAADEVSLNYPQLAALYQLDLRLGQKDGLSPVLRAQAVSVLEKAASSPVPKVREKAEQLQKKSLSKLGP